MNSELSRWAPKAGFLLFVLFLLNILLSPAGEPESSPWQEQDWTVEDQGGFNTPALVTPKDGAYIHDTNVTFTWNYGGHDENTTYILQISAYQSELKGPYRTPQFIEVDLQIVVPGTQTVVLGELNESLYPAAHFLKLGQLYYWRVRNADDQIHWSTIGSFHTGTTNQLGQELLEHWGMVLLILGGVLVSCMIAGVFLAKEENARPVRPEYTASEVLTTPAPGDPGYHERGGGP